MAKYYQVPCRCGKIHEFRRSQAGSMVECSCAERLEVPTFLELERFPTVERELASTDTRNLTVERDAGVRQRRAGLMIFLLAVSVVSAGFVVYFAVTCPKIPRVEEMNMFDTWLVWQDLRPGVATPMNRFENMRLYRIAECKRWMWTLGTLSLVSLSSVLWLLFRPVESRSAKKRRGRNPN